MADELSTGPYEAETRLHEAIASFEQARDAGRDPSPQEWLGRYPEVASRLAAFFADQEQLHRLAGPLRPDASRVALAPGGEPETFPEIPGYEILEIIGRGGMGVVYKARQLKPERIVALKVIRPDRLEGLSPEERRKAVERFTTEAQAAAQLDHESIVNVHEVGEVHGRPFYSMRYVVGTSLHGLIKHGPLEGWRAAAYVEKVARAVHEAHRHGILHRDLKPDNILVETNGDRPLVADFGLAKLLQGGQGVTATGDVMGAPSYMSPEQAEGSANITVATDVYGLGATLYALLTGRPPFRGDDPILTLRKVINEEPLPPRNFNPGVHRDLETICLKCLEKEPGKRYASAKELADRLLLFLEGKPIPDRPITNVERLWRWCRRNPAAAALLAVSAVAALAVVGVLVALGYSAQLQGLNAQLANEKSKVETALQAESQAKEAEAGQRRIADRARKDLEIAAYYNRVLMAYSDWSDANIARAEELLAACPVELRNWEWRYVNRLCHTEILTLRGHIGSVRCVAYSPDGNRLASGGNDGTLRIWDAGNGKETLNLKGHIGGGVESVVFSPDGKLLASAAQDKTVRIWNAWTGKEIRTLSGHTDWVFAVSFSPDGRRLASASKDGTVKIWEVASGQEMRTLRGHGTEVLSVVFSPDGKRLASGGMDMKVRVWDMDTGQEALSLVGHTYGVTSLAFSPDGKWLASGSYDRTVKVWDIGTRKEVLKLDRHASGIFCVAFSPDGRRVASASRDRTVKVFDATTGQELLTLKGHTNWALGVAFRPDGVRLASASADGTVRVWDAWMGQEALTFNSDHAPHHPGVDFSPDGRWLAAASPTGTIKVWDVLTAQLVMTLKGNATDDWMGAFCAFSPDGKQLASAGSGGTVKVWDTRTWKEMQVLKGHTKDVTWVAFTQDGKRLASASWDQTIRIWDTEIWKETVSPLTGHANEVTCVAFSPDGKRLASASVDQTVKVWEVATGLEVLNLKGHAERVWRVAFSPDGRRLASASRDQTIKIWDAETGKEMIQPLKGHMLDVVGVAFSPDGKRLASGGWDGTVKVWEVGMGHEVLTLKGRVEVMSVAFSRDGKLASSYADGTVKVFETTSLEPADVLKREASFVVRELTDLLDVPPEESKAPKEAYQRALGQLDRLIKAEPNNETLRRLRGRTHQCLGQVDKAIADYSKAIELKPDDAEGFETRGLLYEQQQDWTKALADFSKAIQLKPSRWEPWCERGRVHGQQEQWAKARADFAKAMQLGSTNAMCSVWYALTFAAVKDAAGHRKACATLLEKFGKTENADVANDVAWSCVRFPDAVPDVALAVQLAEKAVAGDPKSYLLLNTLGVALYRANRFEDCIRKLNEAIQAHQRGGTPLDHSNPQDPYRLGTSAGRHDTGGTAYDWLFLAMAHNRLGHTQEAKKWLTKGQEWIDEAIQGKSKKGGPVPSLYWDWRVELKLIRAEAEALLREDPKK